MQNSRTFHVLRTWLVLLCMVATGVGASRPAKAELLLRANDRVVFLGDSITEQRNYTRPFQDFIYANYPGLHVRFFNAGWSGDVTGGALNRLERDVLSLNPNFVTVCLGMNDGRYSALTDDTLNTYRTNLDGIVKALTAKNIRVMVYTPSCVDYDANPKLRPLDYNKTLETLGTVAQEIAQKYNCAFYDIFHPMLATQTVLKAQDSHFTMIPDGVHPNETGGLVMAGCMLQGMGARPLSVLADLDFAQLQRPAHADTIDFATNAVGVPLWASGDAMNALDVAGLSSLLGQRLRVRNLGMGTYTVKINGSSIGQWNSTQLAAGVTLPNSYSPRSRRLYDVTNLKEQNYFYLWRTLRVASESGPATDETVAALMKADDAYDRALAALSPPIDSLSISLWPNLVPAGVGANLAFRKTYTAGDAVPAGFGAGGLTDGSWETDTAHIFATSDKDAFPKTVTIDLGAATPVSCVLLGVPPFGATKTTAVSLSANGQTFKDVGTYMFGQMRERHLYSFPTVSARYVRLTFPDHYEGTAPYSPTVAFVSEAEVYGPAQATR